MTTEEMQQSLEELKSKNEELSKKLKEVTNEAKTRRKDLVSQKEELEKYKNIDIEKYQELFSKEKKLEDEKLKAKGNYEEILKKNNLEHEKALNQLSEQLKKEQFLRENESINNALLQSVSKHNVYNAKDIADLVRPKIDIDDDGIYVKDGDSALIQDGKRVDVDSYLSSFLNDRPQYLKAGQSGSGSFGGAGKDDQPSTSRGLIAQGLRKKGVA